jgi:hypothetical protein
MFFATQLNAHALPSRVTLSFVRLASLLATLISYFNKP